MKKQLASFAASLSAVLLGTAALWFGTAGFVEFTIETARKNAVIKNPRPVPAVVLENHNSHPLHLGTFQKDIVVVDFIYTQCPTFCQLMGSEFTRLQTYVKESGNENKIALLSISFDAINDTPLALNAYLKRFKADDAIWQAARAFKKQDETRLLQEFGVTVLTDQYGGYIHNAAYYLIIDNHLQRIYDYTELDQLIAEMDKRVSAAP